QHAVAGIALGDGGEQAFQLAVGGGGGRSGHVGLLLEPDIIRRPGRAPDQAASAIRSGAPARIRWSKAARAAVAPAPIEITICLYGTVVQSPAANTPGSEVRPRSSMTISPRGLSSRLPLSQSVLGSRPIWTKTPSR